MQFVLVGPNQGKSIRLAGCLFRNGVTDVDDKAEDLHNLLQQFNSAYPAHMVEKDGDGNLALKEGVEPTQRLDFTPTLVQKAEEPEPVPVDLNSLTKAELVEIAVSMGIDATGNKTELLERIRLGS